MVDDDRPPQDTGIAPEAQPSDEELWALVRILAEPGGVCSAPPRRRPPTEQRTT